MKKLVSLLTLSLLTVVGASAQEKQLKQSRTQHSQFKVGDKAPDFELRGTTGNVKLSDFAGKKNVVVAFFPAAFTAGCTTELTSFTKDNSKFTDANTQVVAISTDFVATLSHWSKELDANFPMLSDHSGKVAKMYGILDENNWIALRTTFVVGMDGKIADIHEERDAIDISGALAACNRLKK
jgi:thioredoxin-dependent peroxiredoxin